MHKYNGESLTTYEPRGPWSQIHRELSSLGSVHIDNVHILANLEPFRYGSPDFIQKSVQAMHRVHGANGLHLYPQASYWDWPYTADKLPEGERLCRSTGIGYGTRAGGVMHGKPIVRDTKKRCIGQISWVIFTVAGKRAEISLKPMNRPVRSLLN